jgi:hypothetical protein
MIKQIVIPIKQTGDSLSATEFNLIVTGINDNSQDLQTSLNTKVDAVQGKGLSTNDYSDEERAKVEALVAGGGDGTGSSDVTKAYVDSKLAIKANTSDLLPLVTKTYVDNSLLLKANASDISDFTTKSYVDNSLLLKVNTSDLTSFTTKTYVDNGLVLKANATDLLGYTTKTYVDNGLLLKANASDIAAFTTKTYVDNSLLLKANASVISTLATKTELETAIALVNNFITEQLANKVSLVGGYVDPNQLPTINFSDTNFSGDGSTENPITVIGASGGGTVTPSLSAPTLTASAASTTQINVSWNRVTNSTGFVLERASNAGFTAGLTTIYTGNALTYSNTGLTPSTMYYFRIKANATGFSTSNYGSTSVSTQGVANTTPSAPTLTANDTANSLTATHALGTSEIVMSVNGATYVAYAAIAVGDVARVAGYYKFKIKSATGRNESTVVESPAFTGSVVVPDPVPETGAGVPVTSFQYLLSTELIDTNTVQVLPTASNGQGNAAPNFSIPDGESGWISQKFAAFTQTGEGSTSDFTLGVGIDPHYGSDDAVVAVWAQTGGSICYRTFGNPIVYGPNGVLAINGIIRLRATATTAYIEYSNNGGTSFTQVANTPRPVGALRSKLNFIGNRRKAVDLRSYNG